MTGDIQLLEIVRHRFEVTGALSYLHSRQLHHQQVKGGLEFELAQIRDGMAQHEPLAPPPPSLIELEHRLADAETALRACR